MKKVFTRLLLMAMLCVPWVTQAQEMTICDGTSTNGYYPVVGSYADCPQTVQMIYPSELLTAANDEDINTLKFFSATASQEWGATWTVKLSETTDSSLTAVISDTGMTTVFTGILSVESGEMVIDLDQPYHYNGGNLIISISQAGTGSYHNVNFYGTSLSSINRSAYTYYYSYEYTNASPFLPKLYIQYGTITCHKVYDITFSNTTSSSFDVSWTDGGDASLWEVTTMHGDSIISVEYVSDTTATISDLASSTYYQVGIRAICGNGDTSIYAYDNIRTECSEITLPYTIDFEDPDLYYSMDPCWIVQESGSSSGYPYVYNYGAHSGDYLLYMYSYDGNNTVVSPRVPLEPNLVQVKFWANGSSNNSQLRVGYTTDPSSPSNNHYVETFNLTTEYSQYTVSFANLTLEDSIYVVLSQAYSSSYTTVNIDDITIRQLPNCVEPTYFAVDSVGATSVSLSWVDSVASAWEIAYGPEGFDPDDEDGEFEIESINGDTFVTIEDLSDTIVWEFYLRANCDDENSEWTIPITAMPNVFSMRHTGVDTIYACGGAVVDEGGIDGPYQSNANGTLIIKPSEEDMAVRVTGTLSSENNYDFLTIYDGIGTSGPQLGRFSGPNVNIDTIAHGPMTLLFTSDGSNNGDGFLLQVSCEPMNTCIEPYNVTVSNIEPASAKVAWQTMSSGADYVVTVTDPQTGNSSSYATTETSYILGGLEASTPYIVNVRSVCESGDTSSAASAIFTTANLPCTGSDTTVTDTAYSNFDGTNYNGYGFLYSSYSYSISETVIPIQELNGLGQITALKYHTYVSGSTPVTRKLTFFLDHTPVADLTAGYQQPVSPVKVFSGDVTMNDGDTVTINFTTPFDYNGSDNLMLFVIDSTGSTSYSLYYYGNSAYVNSTYVYRTRYYTSYSPININNFPTNMYTSSYNPALMFVGHPCSEHSTCIAPNVIVTANDVDQIDVMWQPGYNETSWTVEHKESSNSVWTVDAANTSATTYSFTNLSPNTTYDIRISVACGVSKTLTVTTPCNASPLPLVEDFSSFNAPSTIGSSVQSCWNRINTYTSGEYPYKSTNNGINCLYYYGTNGTTSMIVLPALQASLDSLQISFAANNIYSSTEISIGALIDPSDISTFEPITTIMPGLPTSEWRNYETTLANYSGNARFIAIGLRNCSGYQGFYLSDIMVDYIPTCPRPANITLDSVVENEAYIHWPSTGAAEYVVEYGPAGFTPGQGQTETVNTNSVHLDNLLYGEIYDYYVTGICTGNDTSHASFRQQFTTECATITTLPYVQNFDNGPSGSGVLPTCWASSATNYPYVYQNISMASSGSNSLYFYSYGSTNLTAVAPELDATLPALNQLQVAFNFRNTYVSDAIIVGAVAHPDSIDTFVPIDTVVNAAGTTSTYNYYEVPLSSYTGDYRYIALRLAIVGTGTYAYANVDDFSIDMIPTCPRVDSISVSNVDASSAEVAWHERGSASQWQIAITDVQANQTTYTTANSNPYTLTNLNAATLYSVNVRPICSGADTGHFSISSVQFMTSQIVASMPYSYDFETPGEWANWQTIPVNYMYSAAADWTRGTADAHDGQYSLYISSDNGASVDSNWGDANYAVRNLVAFRDIDFGTTDTSVTISFDFKMGRHSDNYYAGLMVALVDPSVLPTSGSNSYYTTPWGYYNTINVIEMLQGNSSWTDVSMEAQHVSGVQRLVFYAFGYKPSSGTFSGAWAEVDNLNVDYTTCLAPTDLDIDSVESTVAILTWNGDAQALYEVSYGPYPGGPYVEAYTNTNSITLNGLQPSSRYAYWVRKICGNADTSVYSDGFDFYTKCDVITSFPYYEPFDTDPLETCWAAWSFDNEDNSDWELYDYDDNSYMSSSYNMYANADDWLITPGFALPADVSDFTLSWRAKGSTYQTYATHITVLASTSGAANASAFTDTLFSATIPDSWDSTAVSLASYAGQTVYFAFIHDSYNDNGPYLDDVRINGVGEASLCQMPNGLTVNATYDAATVSWTGNADNYEYEYKSTTDATWTNAVAVTTSTTTINGLQPSTNYQFRVRSVCDAETGLTSDWATVDFTTDSMPCFVPTELHTTDLGYTEATFAWTSEGVATQWMLHVWNNAMDTVVTVSTNPATISGLHDHMDYSAAVKALCSAEIESEYSDTIQFTTATCAQVTGVVVNDITYNSAVVSWTSTGAASYEIDYGPRNFSAGTGTRITVADGATSTTLLSLQEDYNYSIFVRSVCADGVVGEWSSQVDFATPERQGINTVDGMQLSIYPNPTTTSTTVALSGISGISGEVSITIVDMNGRTVKSDSMSCEGDCTKTIEVGGLAQGAYFVRVSGEGVNMVKKLVVK